MEEDLETYEIKLSDGETYNVTGDSYRALDSATRATGQHTRYVKVTQRAGGHGSAPGRELIVNCDHVVSAWKLESA